jgi:tripartite-type tricarboxylate transporter receptor subunit TctC
MAAKLTRRAFLASAPLVLTLPALAAGTWPARAVTLVHGFPPGGPVDTLSRILAEGFSKRLGQQVVIEARPGATGTTAAAQVAHSAPDGYTWMAVPATYVATAAVFRNLPFRPLDDFIFVSTTAEYPFVLVTHADGGISSIAALVQTARARKEPLQYGTAGVGSLQHLTMELLAQQGQIHLQHIPYKGGAPAINDILGKRLDVVIDPPTALLPHIESGKLRALAVTSAARFFALPKVPTVAESGFPALSLSAYQGIAGPAGLSAPIVAKLNRVIAETLADPQVVARLRSIGNLPRPSSGEEFRTSLAADIARWNKVVDEAHIARI